jgi:hypothetical protein
MYLNFRIRGELYFLYEDDVRTSQEAWTSTARYGDRFTFSMWMMFVPHRKHTYVLQRPDTGIALLFIFR